MRVLFLSIFVALFSFANASLVIGSIESVKGSVKVKNEGSFKKTKLKAGAELKSGDLVTTSRKGTAVIKLSDGSSIVLGVSSTVHFKSPTDTEQTAGRVYYKITSRDAKNSLKVKTPFAIIGIKGTTFVVDAKEDGGVKLKEGLIGVASIKAEFALYRKEMMAAFNNFKSDEMSAFEKFKAGGEEPKPQMTKEFDLKEGNTISFSGNKVKESAWNEDDDAEFAEFEALVDALVVK